MRLTQRHAWLLLAVAITIWVAVGVFTMAIAYADTRTSPLPWLLLFGTYGAALFGSILLGHRSRSGQIALVGLEIVCVVAMAAVPHRGDPGPLLAPIALQATLVFETRTAIWVVIAQSLLVWLGRGPFLSDPMSWLYWALNLAAQVIAVGAVYALRREAEISLALERSNAELRATQALLAESAAQSERTRISRELHDAWGHDLTALSLQLEYASHVSPEVARPSIVEARDLAKSLLGKVRDVVGTLRRYEGHDIKPVLQALATGAPQLRVHLDIPDTLALQSAEVAQTLMRSAQEIITNTLRHAGARNLWLALKMEDGGVRFDSRDDGAGTDQLRLGHGLEGLIERFHQQGGRITFESARGSGFKAIGWIPVRSTPP